MNETILVVKEKTADGERIELHLGFGIYALSFEQAEAMANAILSLTDNRKEGEVRADDRPEPNPRTMTSRVLD